MGKGLMSYIWATEAFNNGMASGRRQQCHYFAHFLSFPNLLGHHKHGSQEPPINDSLVVRLGNTQPCALQIYNFDGNIALQGV